MSNVAAPAGAPKRPNKAELDSLIEGIQKEIVEFEANLKATRDEINVVNSGKEGSRGVVETARSALNVLNAEKRQLMAERADIITQRDAARDLFDSRKTAEKSMKSEVKYGSIEEVDNQIRQLERMQMTSSLSLQEEKKIIADIKKLQQSKGAFANLASVRQSMANEREGREEIEKQYKMKMEQVKAIGDKITSQKGELDKLIAESKASTSNIPALRTKQGEIKASIDERYTKMKELRKQFKESEDAYYTYVKEERKKQKEQREKEIAERKAREEEAIKKAEAEALSRPPYEEEVALCSFLITYLQKYNKEEAEVAAPETFTKPDPFMGGARLIQRDMDDYCGNGGSLKKKGKKKGGTNAKPKEVPIRHDVDSIGLFDEIKVSPPLSVAAVPAALKMLEEKKAYYDTLERGAEVSIAEKRRQKEREMRGDGNAEDAGSNKSMKAAAPKASSQAAFPGLVEKTDAETPENETDNTAEAATSAGDAPESGEGNAESDNSKGEDAESKIAKAGEIAEASAEVKSENAVEDKVLEDGEIAEETMAAEPVAQE
jgi:uncharacterized coiled-coil DUF342 family protein